MLQFMRAFKGQLLLALIFLGLTLSQQYLYFAIKGMPLPLYPIGKYLTIFLLFLVCTLIKGKLARYLALSFILLLNFFQMVHLSYYGTQILPSEIWLLFSEIHEVTGSLKEELLHLILPFVLTLLPAMVGWKMANKMKPQYTFRGIGVLLVIYLIYNPVRTYVTGNQWGRQPSTQELPGFNVYLAMSYFAGKILPHKLANSTLNFKNRSNELSLLRKKNSEWEKVILVLGESHSPHNMQLFGYEKETTPYLNSLKGQPNFFSTVGLSGGVSTDIALAFFLNMAYGKGGSLKAAKGDHCLLKLARSQEFRTHFWSTQSKQQLRYIAPYICPGSLNEFKTLEDLDPEIADENAASDLKLLTSLKETLSQPGKDFILLHQRGSHSPWNLRYSAQSSKFKASPEDDRKFHYDNSIVEFDGFWKELDKQLADVKAKTLVIYVSDHGEATGMNGQWGHGFLAPHSFEIPVIMRSYNRELPPATKDLPSYIPHYNLSLFISHELGLVFNQSPLEIPVDYEIYGNDIDGFAGAAQIKFDQKKYQFTVK